MHALGTGIAILLAILICAGGAAIAIFRKYKVSQSKGAGASEAGGQTKEGALSKRFYRSSEIVQNRTKPREPIDIQYSCFGSLNAVW